SALRSDRQPRPAQYRARRAADVRNPVTSAALQPAAHVIELIEAAISDLQLAAIAAVLDADVQPERIRQAFLERQCVGVLLGSRPALRSFPGVPGSLLRDRLDGAHIEPLFDDDAGHLLRVGLTYQRAGV